MTGLKLLRHAIIVLLFGFYALYLLTISYTGFALILLSLVFISGGVLGVWGMAAGAIVFIIGSILVAGASSLSYSIACINALLLLGLFISVIKSRKKRHRYIMDSLLGAEGRALDVIESRGKAVIRGAIWSVDTKEPIDANKRIKVVAADGLQLQVEEVNLPDVSTRILSSQE